jgi:hypothetical protein
VIKASERNPQAKPAVETVPSAKSTVETVAEPAREVTVYFQKLDHQTGDLTPVFTYKMTEDQVAPFEDAITNVIANFPKAPKKIVGRPPLRVIVTGVNKKDPDFIGTGGEPYVVGEVVELSEFIAFVRAHNPCSKLNASKLRYYFNNGKDAEQNGYSVRLFEQFLKKDLFSPVKRDHQALADAHVAWCLENKVVPFQNSL